MPDWLTTLILALPLLGLIVVMTKPRPMPASLALPLAALVLYGLKLLLPPTDTRLVNAAVVNGLLAALAPLMVVWGAVLLFRTMEQTGATDVIRRWLARLSPHPVSQLMIVGWSFSFLIEGISGFGTPAALAAPLLVAAGFPALRVALLALIMNTVPVSFGAVGMPLWFGLGELDLDPAQLDEIGRRTALLHATAAPVIPLLALRMVVDWTVIRGALPFILLSIAATVVPYVVAAWWNPEFPAIAGGAIGLVVTVWLARRGVGLGRQPAIAAEHPATVTAGDPGPPGPDTTAPSRGELARALFPIAATVLLLLVTRIEVLGLRTWLQALEPALRADLGGLGELGVSRSLVLQWQGILGSPLNWSHALLYVPSLLPFLLVSVVTMRLYRSPGAEVKSVFAESWQRIRRPLGAFLGALVFARLMMTGPGASPVQLLAGAMAEVAGPAWQGVAVLLGALGSFFSGSATVSNLTFGAIQLELAELRGLDPTTILALQSVGAALGNMVCIHNIVAVCSILGLQRAEGDILRRNTPPLLVYALITAGASFLLFG